MVLRWGWGTHGVGFWAEGRREVPPWAGLGLGAAWAVWGCPV